MSPRPLNSDGEIQKSWNREELLAELVGMREMVAALKETQVGCERVVGMLDGIAEPFFILDDATRVIHANSSAGRLLDIACEELPGKRLWDVYPKGKDTLFYHLYAKAAANRSPASFTEKHQRTGKWYDINLYPVDGGMVIIFQDITTRWHKDEVLRLALVLLQHMKENIFLLRADGRLFHVNRETGGSLGYTTGELIRMSIFDLVPQECLGEWHDILVQIKQRGSATFESKLRAKDGKEFPVEVYANYIKLHGQSYYTVSARDNTERKIAEREINDARSRAEIYLDLMGHDIRNQNMISSGNIEMAIETLEKAGKIDPESLAFLKNSLQSLNNTSVLIDNVQKLQRKTSEVPELQKTDICAVLESVIGEFMASSARDMDIRYRCRQACTVNANELLKDVFLNLIGNAIMHSSPDRHLTIDVALDIVEKGGRKHCEVTIADNGPGIPDWLKARLFQRFASGKTGVHGKGLGLYLVMTLLEHYGGRISVEDRVPGDDTKGAMFVVTIPSAE